MSSNQKIPTNSSLFTTKTVFVVRAINAYASLTLEYSDTIIDGPPVIQLRKDGEIYSLNPEPSEDQEIL